MFEKLLADTEELKVLGLHCNCNPPKQTYTSIYRLFPHLQFRIGMQAAKQRNTHGCSGFCLRVY